MSFSTNPADVLADLWPDHDPDQIALMRMFCDQPVSGFFDRQDVANAATLTLEGLDMAAQRFRSMMEQPEPIAEWMRGQGIDPDEGWVLCLPPGQYRYLGAFPPPYVREGVDNVFAILT